MSELKCCQKSFNSFRSIVFTPLTSKVQVEDLSHRDKKRYRERYAYQKRIKWAEMAVVCVAYCIALLQKTLKYTLNGDDNPIINARTHKTKTTLLP